MSVKAENKVTLKIEQINKSTRKFFLLGTLEHPFFPLEYSSE